MTELKMLSAGAAQGLARALQAEFEAASGATLQARFGAVGAMQEAMLSGEACDVLVLTQKQVEALTAQGLLRPGSAAPLGRVRTGVAVRAGMPWPEVSTPTALKAALLAASGIYFPDPERATAGIHFAKVLRELGVADELRDRLRTYPNGATAMREMAGSSEAQPLGCTQVTEIRYTPGVELVGLLPPEFELATLYTAAVTTASTQPELAADFVARMSGPGSRDLRNAGGFED